MSDDHDNDGDLADLTTWFNGDSTISYTTQLDTSYDDTVYPNATNFENWKCFQCATGVTCGDSSELSAAAVNSVPFDVFASPVEGDVTQDIGGKSSKSSHTMGITALVVAALISNLF